MIDERNAENQPRRKKKESDLPQTNDVYVFMGRIVMAPSPKKLATILEAEVTENDVVKIHPSYSPSEDPVEIYPQRVRETAQKRGGKPRAIIATTDIFARDMSGWQDVMTLFKKPPQRTMKEIIDSLKQVSEEYGATFLSEIPPKEVWEKRQVPF